jgi:hypothetical protein
MPAVDRRGEEHSTATVETMKAWFDWAYKQRNLFRPTMKLIRATKRNGPKIMLRVDYTNRDYGNMSMTVDDYEAPRLIRDFAKAMILKCPDASPFQE